MRATGFRVRSSPRRRRPRAPLRLPALLGGARKCVFLSRTQAPWRFRPRSNNLVPCKPQIESEVPWSSRPAAVAEDAPTKRPAPEGAAPPAPAAGSVSLNASAGVGDSARDFLERMVAKALALSPDVREATAKWEASRFDIDEIEGQRWPQLQVAAREQLLQVRQQVAYDTVKALVEAAPQPAGDGVERCLRWPHDRAGRDAGRDRQKRPRP